MVREQTFRVWLRKRFWFPSLSLPKCGGDAVPWGLHLFASLSNTGMPSLLLQWIFTNTRNCTFLGHNGRCYDNYFILRALEDQGHYPAKMQNGAHLTMLTVHGVQARFVDTLSFMPWSLSKLAIDQEIGDIVKKVFFPYTFNVLEHKIYVGTVLDRSYFGVNRMSAKKRVQFEAW